MKKNVLRALLVAAFLFPGISSAKVPLFFNTGDELFEIEGAPKFDDGFSVGFACKHFGLFGADIWTWDCKLMAINMDEFSAADLPDEQKAGLESKFSIGDRKRGFWNHFGIITLLVVLAGYAAMKGKRKS